MKRFTRIEKKMLLDILLPYLEDEYIIFDKENERWHKKDRKNRISYIAALEKIIYKIERSL